MIITGKRNGVPNYPLWAPDVTGWPSNPSESVLLAEITVLARIYFDQVFPTKEASNSSLTAMT